MITKKECIAVFLAILLMSFLLVFNNFQLDINHLLKFFVISFIIVLVSVIAKKITASNIDVEAEIKIWEFRRYWFYKQSYLKSPLPMGMLLPLLFAFFSGGIIKFMTFLQFNATALPSKVVKKYGVRRISGIMEWDDALIGFYSTLALLVLASVCSFINVASFPFAEFAKYSLYYALYNLIPFSPLDGAKIFFGSRPLYIFTLVISGISALIVLL